MRTNYYALVYKNGNFITTDAKLPIYWNKEVAEKEAEKFKVEVKAVKISKVRELINP